VGAVAAVETPTFPIRTLLLATIMTATASRALHLSLIADLAVVSAGSKLAEELRVSE